MPAAANSRAARAEQTFWEHHSFSIRILRFVYVGMSITCSLDGHIPAYDVHDLRFYVSHARAKNMFVIFGSWDDEDLGCWGFVLRALVQGSGVCFLDCIALLLSSQLLYHQASSL